jgi:hypothetical protein
MIIDRHNYEEYFLLYIDNELTVEQKKQVDLFIQENPDLEEELIMLKQSMLIPDDSIVFDKKYLLMKEENDAFINLNNYEEWLVLYVDDELNAHEKVVVEKFAKAHPHVQQELALFKQTKSQPENIVFADKEVLYRREKTVRVISLQWWKVAVAAVLIISAGVTAYSVLINKNNGEATNKEVAKAPIKNKKVSHIENSVTPGTQQQSSITNDQHKQIAFTPSLKKPTETKKKPQEQPKQGNNQQLVHNDLQKVNEPEIAKHSAVDINQPTVEQSKMSDAVALNAKMHKDNFNNDPVTIPVVEPPHNSTSNDVLIASNDTENKRLRGFFRKATRIIERTTNINPANDDNKVLIGGMAINLK